LSLMLGKHRLGVKGVDVAWSTIHEAKDDIFRAGGEVRLAIGMCHAGEGEPSKSSRGRLEPCSARNPRMRGARSYHWISPVIKELFGIEKSMGDSPPCFSVIEQGLVAIGEIV